MAGPPYGATDAAAAPSAAPRATRRPHSLRWLGLSLVLAAAVYGARASMDRPRDVSARLFGRDFGAGADSASNGFAPAESLDGDDAPPPADDGSSASADDDASLSTDDDDALGFGRRRRPAEHRRRACLGFGGR